MKTRAIYSIIAVLAVTVFFTLFSLSGNNNQQEQAPDVSMQTIDGRTLAPADFKGTPALITFWATTCAICVKEMPHLVELYHDLNKDGLEIIAVAMPYDPPKRVIEFSSEKQLPYPVVIDIAGNVTAAFGNVNVTPTTILIGPDSKIINRHTGKFDIQKLRTRIENLLPNTKTAAL